MGAFSNWFFEGRRVKIFVLYLLYNRRTSKASDWSSLTLCAHRDLLAARCHKVARSIKVRYSPGPACTQMAFRKCILLRRILHTHSVRVYTHVFKETKPNDVRVPEASMLLVRSGPHGLQSGTRCCPQGQGRALAADDGTGRLAGLRGRSRAFETGRVSEKQMRWNS